MSAELSRVLDALERDVLEGAVSLLGTLLVCEDVQARVVEVEAYRTPDDPACHAHRGLTPRNQVMYGPAGLAYVYFNYGVHWMLNVTAHSDGNPAAVLIRAAQPISGLDVVWSRRPKARSDRQLLSGPGKLAAGLGITGDQNGMNLFDTSSRLRFGAGEPVTNILSGPRIGIRNGLEHPWRFVDGDSLMWASRPLTRLQAAGAGAKD